MTDQTSQLRSAVTAFNAGETKKAAATCHAILASDPDQPQALNMLAAIAGAEQKFDMALQYLKKALNSKPDDAQIRFNLACCYQQSGDRVNAKRTFHDVVERKPEQIEAWLALGKMHQEDDEPDDCIAAFSRVIEQLKKTTPNPQIMSNAYQGIALAEHKRHNLDASLKAYQVMVDLNGNDDRGHAGLGWVLRDQGHYEDAIMAFLRASDIRPDRAPYLTNAAIVMMRLGNFDGARPLLDRALAIDPDNKQTLSALGVLMWEINEDNAYKEIFDYERFVQPFDDVEVPEGYSSHQEFHNALIEEIRNHPSLVGGRATNTTRNGVQTTNIMVNPGPAVSALRDIFNKAVSQYISDPDHQSDTPGTNWQSHWRILGWGVILSSQGHQASHNHPTGMVSGVYYIRIPEEVNGSGDQAGFIEFGPPNEQYVSRREPPQYRVQPREGRLCLFPSHYWHRTIPFDSKTERICLAFDAVPAF